MAGGDRIFKAPAMARRIPTCAASVGCGNWFGILPAKVSNKDLIRPKEVESPTPPPPYPRVPMTRAGHKNGYAQCKRGQLRLQTEKELIRLEKEEPQKLGQVGTIPFEVQGVSVATKAFFLLEGVRLAERFLARNVGQEK